MPPTTEADLNGKGVAAQSLPHEDVVDKRPDIQNLVWCSASTGEEHSSCTERRHWKGAAGDIALDDEEEEDDDDDDDGGGEQQQQEEGGEQ